MNLSKEIKEGNTEEGILKMDSFGDLEVNIQLKVGVESNKSEKITKYTKSSDSEDKFLNAVIKKSEKRQKNVELTDQLIDKEGTRFVNPWKLKNVFPARVTEIHELKVLLEVVIDDETVEEQEYESIFFEGFDLKDKKFFKIKFYERPNEQRLVMVDATNSLKREDFPSVDFSHISNEDLFF